jgi:hypothetical protein
MLDKSDVFGVSKTAQIFFQKNWQFTIQNLAPDHDIWGLRSTIWEVLEVPSWDRSLWPEIQDLEMWVNQRNIEIYQNCLSDNLICQIQWFLLIMFILLYLFMFIIFSLIINKEVIILSKPIIYFHYLLFLILKSTLFIFHFIFTLFFTKMSSSDQ